MSYVTAVKGPFDPQRVATYRLKTTDLRPGGENPSWDLLLASEVGRS